ncbi:MAG: ABC transporter permease [Burkholderiaceae bacterium]
MIAYLFRRFLTLLATLLGAAAIIFIGLDLLPGNAAQILMGADADPEAVKALAQQLGLDRPAIERFAEWIWGLSHMELGNSYAYSAPVAELILQRMSVTVPLALMAMSITTLLALTAGVYAASKQNQAGDVGIMGLSQLGVAIPNFWFAILLILLFAVQLNWLKAGGFDGWDEGVWEGFKALILPAVSLAVVQAAILARITRSAILEVLREDYIRTARAKGLGAQSVLWGHALRNALIPVVTVMGLQFANLLTGTIVIENVFYLPGLGRLIFQSIANRDLIVVRNCVMLLTIMVVVVNFIVDLLYVLIDPRIKSRQS